MRPYNTVSTYYVSPSGRDMTGQSPAVRENGDGPFGSIQSALTAVSELRRSGVSQPVTIRLLPGEYEFSSPLTIGPDVTNITIESYDAREKAVISGGKKIGGFKADVFGGVECLSADPLIADTLGGHVFTHYTEGKRREWDEYRTRVTDWELKKYMLVY